MHNTIREAAIIPIGIISTLFLLTICMAFTIKAREASAARLVDSAVSRELSQEREWKAAEGEVTGADIVDFIVRHKDICVIVIQDSLLTVNPKVKDYCTGNALIMGLNTTKNIPDTFWEATYIYDNIIGKQGTRPYAAYLLYDGQLAPEFDASIQIRGGAITGIQYVAG